MNHYRLQRIKDEYKDYDDGDHVTDIDEDEDDDNNTIIQHDSDGDIEYMISHRRKDTYHAYGGNTYHDDMDTDTDDETAMFDQEVNIDKTSISIHQIDKKAFLQKMLIHSINKHKEKQFAAEHIDL